MAGGTGPNRPNPGIPGGTDTQDAIPPWNPATGQGGRPRLSIGPALGGGGGNAFPPGFNPMIPGGGGGHSVGPVSPGLPPPGGQGLPPERPNYMWPDGTIHATPPPARPTGATPTVPGTGIGPGPTGFTPLTPGGVPPGGNNYMWPDGTIHATPPPGVPIPQTTTPGTGVGPPPPKETFPPRPPKVGEFPGWPSKPVTPTPKKPPVKKLPVVRGKTG
jgi:hypothetical protein